jgi:hypothetical protein
MSTKKNAPKKSAPPTKNNNGTRRSTGSNSNPSKDKDSATRQTVEDPDLKTLSVEINRSGHSIGSVIEMLKNGQTRTGPGYTGEAKQLVQAVPMGIIQQDFMNIEQALATQDSRLREIKQKLCNLGYFESEDAKNEKEKVAPLSEAATVTSKVSNINLALRFNNSALIDIINHLDHLFSPSSK